MGMNGWQIGILGGGAAFWIWMRLRMRRRTLPRMVPRYSPQSLEVMRRKNQKAHSEEANTVRYNGSRENHGMLVVTGGAGFIGSVLVAALNARGRTDILIVDEFEAGPKWKNLRGKKFLDVVSPEQFAHDLAAGAYAGKLDGILHIGAITDTSFPDMDELYARNVRCTRTLAQWALANEVRFVYASSASVYGDGELGFSDDDGVTPNLLPLNPYAFSKWLSDMETIREGWTDKVAGLRFFNVFGPNEYHKGRMASVIWHSTNQIRETGQIKLFQSHKEGYADGEQKRDFVYVKDVCAVVLWFLDHPEANGIYNVGAGQARTFKDLAKAIFQALGKSPEISFIPTPENIRNAYQYHTQADLTRLRAIGCDVPFTTLEDAVSDYVGEYLQNETNPYL
jgi:ADP-L-glycero-D-manno-heptose 6-epimerase